MDGGKGNNLKYSNNSGFQLGTKVVPVFTFYAYGCLEKLEFSSEDKKRENQKAQHT